LLNTLALESSPAQPKSPVQDLTYPLTSITFLPYLVPSRGTYGDCEIPGVNDRPQSGRLGLTAIGRKDKNTSVFRTLRLQPGAWHPVSSRRSWQTRRSRKRP